MRHGISILSQTSLTACRLHTKPVPFVLPQKLCRHQRRHTSSTAPPPILADFSRKWSTPLAKTIGDAIEATGPISIAAYMRQCLTNPDGGYYTSTRLASGSSSDTEVTEIDPFGKHGDFITSPEISQIFGELVGVWFMTEWLAQGRIKTGIQLIELGPGRGTLMSDILRTVTQFKAFAGAVESVWLVEAGEGMRMKQRDVLCGKEVEMREMSDRTGRNTWWEAESKFGGIKVRWVEDIALLPKQEDGISVPFIVAHEFFDALPIHAFESIAPIEETDQRIQASAAADIPRRNTTASKTPQWRELLVNTAKRKFSLSETITSNNASESIPKPERDPDPDFQLTLAKASTPSSLVLPNRPRYHGLKSQPGSRIEISPDSARYVQDFARRIGHDSNPPNPNKGTHPHAPAAGAALIVDYGPHDRIPINSLRGIRKHSIISPFVHAGQADISADVDFGALADAALEASDAVEVHGPVEQEAWLSQLGIRERANALAKVMRTTQTSDGKEKQESSLSSFESGWKRLVESGPRGMGKAYKVMAILPENGGRRKPVGFGGNVVS